LLRAGIDVARDLLIKNPRTSKCVLHYYYYYYQCHLPSSSLSTLLLLLLLYNSCVPKAESHC
jgi:hypothetical protein